MNCLKKKSIEKIEAAIEAVRTLVDARIAAKLSAGRLGGVARELTELLRVVSGIPEPEEEIVPGMAGIAAANDRQ